MHAWFTCVRLRKVNKQLAMCSELHRQGLLELHATEIDTVIARSDYASAWRGARIIAATVIGSRRKFAHTPIANPCMEEVVSKYGLPAVEGGWSAEVITKEHIDNNLEPSFAHRTIECCVDANTQSTYNNFKKNNIQETWFFK